MKQDKDKKKMLEIKIGVLCLAKIRLNETNET